MLQAWGIERRPITKYGLHLSYGLDGHTQWIITWEKSVVWSSHSNKVPNSAQLIAVSEASNSPSLLLVSRKSLQRNNVLSSFVCREWLLRGPLPSGTDCSIAYDSMSICPHYVCTVFFFPHFCCFQHWSLVTHFSLLFGSLNMKTQGQVLKHISTHRGSLCTTDNYLKRMEQMRGGGVLIALWDGSAGQRDVNWRGCHFYVHLIHCSPWWIAGGSVTVFMCTC